MVASLVFLYIPMIFSGFWSFTEYNGLLPPRWVGFETVVFLAALQAISSDLYDAAKVDGASYWRQVRHVTLPALRPTIMFVYIIGIIGSFQVFDQIFVMTDGGPIDSTRTIVFDLY